MLPVHRHNEAGFEQAFSNLRAAGEELSLAAEAAAREIIARVREEGAAAVRAYTAKFDGAKLQQLEVTPAEWEAGCTQVSAADAAALELAAKRIRRFHEQQIPQSWEIKEAGGARMGLRFSPLQRVGIYAPGGKAAYPSTVLMNAVPAQCAGVAEILLATPPSADGALKPELLLAARIAGAHRVFKMGGAQAVAAFAYGAGAPQVDKITGPGNAYVQAAKRLVAGHCAVDADAGPSEVLVVADESANPEWLAADLLSQAEHEEEAAAILVTAAAEQAARVNAALQKQLAELPRRKIAAAALQNHGAIFVARDLQHALALANRYAPEHLALALPEAQAQAALQRVQNAGAVLLGHYAPVAAGDYLAGPNHVLPTGGGARFSSPLGVADFMKRSSFLHLAREKLRELAPPINRLAALEGFAAHARSVEIRLSENASDTVR